ncbi:M48 family metallopeptidase [Massilia sp. MB5]|uniref:M48 family metallopeptidase n=1 Tax=Massilia sp. MB5 TaxID=2919578 RepID=UPI0027D9355E|nr:M48 family metallopeptidase [Massilia sp. MB5]
MDGADRKAVYFTRSGLPALIGLLHLPAPGSGQRSAPRRAAGRNRAGAHAAHAGRPGRPENHGLAAGPPIPRGRALLINNADLCKTQARNLLGFTAKNKYSYPGEYADAARAVLGYNDRLQVSGVLAGSGAASAGLRKGDGLVAANGKALPTGRDAETEAAGVLGPLVSSRASLSMTISRNGREQVLNMPVTRACAYRVDLGNADNINSYADGSRVLLTRGMINFAQSDEAIAFVLAKDIAHNVLGHAGTLRQNASLASMIDNLASVRPDLSLLIGSGGIKPMPQEMDVAADQLALYMLARAGYNIDRAKAFWQRLAAQYPASVLNGYMAVHPATTARYAAIDRTVGEIKAKQAGKRPLVP